MDTTTFWEVIDAAKNASDVVQGLETELAKLPPEAIVEFQNIFDAYFDEAYIWDLWGAAYLIGGGCSDDGFIDFRYGLISKGRVIFEKALANPDSLADLAGDAELDDEMFGYVASTVYKKKTSNDMPRVKSTAPAEPLGDDWDLDDESESNKRLPRLHAIHG